MQDANAASNYALAGCSPPVLAASCDSMPAWPSASLHRPPAKQELSQPAAQDVMRWPQLKERTGSRIGLPSPSSCNLTTACTKEIQIAEQTTPKGILTSSLEQSIMLDVGQLMWHLGLLIPPNVLGEHRVRWEPLGGKPQLRLGLLQINLQPMPCSCEALSCGCAIGANTWRCRLFTHANTSNCAAVHLSGYCAPHWLPSQGRAATDVPPVAPQSGWHS